MRSLLVAAPFVLASPAFGNDFRGTEFGSPCAAIEAREKALGSEQVPISASNGSAYRFTGRAFDRDVSITYLCKDGVLVIGDYHFPQGKYDDAVVDYLAAYNFLLSVYGAPVSAYAQQWGVHGRLCGSIVGCGDSRRVPRILEIPVSFRSHRLAGPPRSCGRQLVCDGGYESCSGAVRDLTTRWSRREMDKVPASTTQWRVAQRGR